MDRGFRRSSICFVCLSGLQYREFFSYQECAWSIVLSPASSSYPHQVLFPSLLLLPFFFFGLFQSKYSTYAVRPFSVCVVLGEQSGERSWFCVCVCVYMKLLRRKPVKVCDI